MSTELNVLKIDITPREGFTYTINGKEWVGSYWISTNKNFKIIIQDDFGSELEFKHNGIINDNSSNDR